jgi:hypothetical protein
MSMTIQTVELHPKMVDALNKGPTTEAYFQVSNDGKWFMHKTVITTFRPVSVAQELVETAVENGKKIEQEGDYGSPSLP